MSAKCRKNQKGFSSSSPPLDVESSTNLVLNNVNNGTCKDLLKSRKVEDDIFLVC